MVVATNRRINIVSNITIATSSSIVASTTTAVAQAVSIAVQNTNQILSLTNGTNIVFFTYDGVLNSYYLYYGNGINNYNAILESNGLYYNVDVVQFNDLSSYTDLITLFNSYFIGTTNQPPTLLNLNLIYGYNALLDVNNINLLYSLADLNKYPNYNIPLYISWNNLQPEYLFYIKNTLNNYIINFGSTIFDELICLNNLLNNFNTNITSSNATLFLLILDDNDYNYYLRFCYLNAIYTMVYQLRSINTLPDFLSAYNTNESMSISSTSQPIPAFCPSTTGNLYEQYISTVLGNPIIFNFSNLPATAKSSAINTCFKNVVIINIPVAENQTDFKQFNHGLAVNKSLDVMLRIYNNLLNNQKTNSYIYINTNSIMGETILIQNLLQTASTFNINTLVQSKQIILSPRTINIDSVISKLNNAQIATLNNLLCINNYNFYTKNLHYNIINSVNCTNNKNYHFNNNNLIDPTINFRQLNLAYLDSLLIDYLINKDIENNNGNYPNHLTIPNQRYLNTGQNIYKEYVALFTNGISALNSSVSRNTNYPNNRKLFITTSLNLLLGNDVMTNLNNALNTGSISAQGFTSNRRITYHRLFKKSYTAYETYSINGSNVNILSGWMPIVNPVYTYVNLSQSDYMINTIYGEIIAVKNEIVQTFNPQDSSFNILLDVIDISNSMLNNSTNTAEILAKNNLMYFISYYTNNIISGIRRSDISVSLIYEDGSSDNLNVPIMSTYLPITSSRIVTSGQTNSIPKLRIVKKTGFSSSSSAEHYFYIYLVNTNISHVTCSNVCLYKILFM